MSSTCIGKQGRSCPRVSLSLTTQAHLVHQCTRTKISFRFNWSPFRHSAAVASSPSFCPSILEWRLPARVSALRFGIATRRWRREKSVVDSTRFRVSKLSANKAHCAGQRDNTSRRRFPTAFSSAGELHLWRMDTRCPSTRVSHRCN